jgi:hypothetical protein
MGNESSSSSVNYRDLSKTHQENFLERLKLHASSNYEIRFAHHQDGKEFEYILYWRTKYLYFSNKEEIINLMNMLDMPYIIHTWYTAGRHRQEYLDICFVQIPMKIKEKNN